MKGVCHLFETILNRNADAEKCVLAFLKIALVLALGLQEFDFHAAHPILQTNNLSLDVVDIQRGIVQSFLGFHVQEELGFRQILDKVEPSAIAFL
jgi:hypothetical protein